MSMKHTKEKALALIKKHGTSDPIKLAKLEGVEVRNKYHEETKGYFIEIFGYKYIVLNQTLNEFIYRFVAGHELYHALFHSENNKVIQFEKGISLTANHDLFQENTIYEREANFFSYYLSESFFKCYEQELPHELIEYIQSNIFQILSRS